MFQNIHGFHRKTRKMRKINFISDILTRIFFIHICNEILPFESLV